MTPWLILVIVIACAVAGIPVGHWRFGWRPGLLDGLLLGPLMLIAAVIPVSKIAEASRARKLNRIDRRNAAKLGTVYLRPRGQRPPAPAPVASSAAVAAKASGSSAA